MLSEISQTEKDKYCVISFYMFNLKIYNKLVNRIKKKKSLSENKLAFTSVEREGGKSNMAEERGEKAYYWKLENCKALYRI